METQPDSSRIFISYRREDSSGYAGRLYDRLRTRFGDGGVFMDIEDIAPGADYGELIDRMSQSVDLLVVLIGPHWLEARDRSGNRRLDDPDDFVRLEISAALDRGVLVMPVLVQGADMPVMADLPPSLAGLSRRNAIELSDARWDYDADRLVRALEGYLPQDANQVKAGRHDSVASHARPSTSVFGSLPAVPASIAGVGLLAVLVWDVLLGRPWHPEEGGIRIGAGVFLIALAGLGLWTRKWPVVVGAGVLGLAGFGLWVLQLISAGHSLEDLMSPREDGIRNTLVGLGMILVVVAGVVGIRQDSSTR
jgi:TIR domain